MLIHLIDGTQDDVKLAYKTIRGELAAYDEALAEKPEILVLNKIDALDPDEHQGKGQGAEEGQQGRGAAPPRASPARTSIRCSTRCSPIWMPKRPPSPKPSAARPSPPGCRDAANALAPYRRLTIKIGSALLVDGKTGKLRAEWLRSLAADLAALKAQGVLAGDRLLGRHRARPPAAHLDARTLPLDQSQAAASAGQIALSQAWAEALGEHGIVTGQILLTPNITEERRYFLNARTTIATLLGLGAIPIINENDSVATAEIRYGDNDRLSARVATMIEADCLILLSDVDGLYTAPPARTPTPRTCRVVAAITPEIEAMAGGAASHLSRGGMTTKVEAGKIATQAGTAMIIAKGTENHPLRALTEGARHTLFAPAESRAQARKRWIMGTLELAGSRPCRCRRRPRPARRARACCRSASPASPANSSAATPSPSSIPMVARSPAASPASAATRPTSSRARTPPRVTELLGHRHALRTGAS